MLFVIIDGLVHTITHDTPNTHTHTNIFTNFTVYTLGVPEMSWYLLAPLVLHGLGFWQRPMLYVFFVTFQHLFHKLTFAFFQFKIESTTQIFCLGAQTCSQFLQVDFRSSMESAEIFYHMKLAAVYLVDANNQSSDNANTSMIKEDTSTSSSGHERGPEAMTETQAKNTMPTA